MWKGPLQSMQCYFILWFLSLLVVKYLLMLHISIKDDKQIELHPATQCTPEQLVYPIVIILIIIGKWLIMLHIYYN